MKNNLELQANLPKLAQNESLETYHKNFQIVNDGDLKNPFYWIQELGAVYDNDYGIVSVHGSSSKEGYKTVSGVLKKLHELTGSYTEEFDVVKAKYPVGSIVKLRPELERLYKYYPSGIGPFKVTGHCEGFRGTLSNPYPWHRLEIKPPPGYEQYFINPTDVQLVEDTEFNELKVSVNNRHINKWYDSNREVHPLKYAIQRQYPVFDKIELGGSSMIVVNGEIYDCVNAASMDSLMHAIASDAQITPAMIPCDLHFEKSGYSRNV